MGLSPFGPVVSQYSACSPSECHQTFNKPQQGNQGAESTHKPNPSPWLWLLYMSPGIREIQSATAINSDGLIYVFTQAKPAALVWDGAPFALNSVVVMETDLPRRLQGERSGRGGGGGRGAGGGRRPPRLSGRCGGTAEGCGAEAVLHFPSSGSFLLSVLPGGPSCSFKGRLCCSLWTNGGPLPAGV